MRLLAESQPHRRLHSETDKVETKKVAEWVEAVKEAKVPAGERTGSNDGRNACATEAV